MLAKIKDFVKRWEKKLLLATAVFLIASLSFAAGFIKGGQIISRPALVIDQELIADLNGELAASQAKGQSLFVASSRGKYYYPIDCSLADNLSEKNKIYFQSREEAESRGYLANSKCEY